MFEKCIIKPENKCEIKNQFLIEARAIITKNIEGEQQCQ